MFIIRLNTLFEKNITEWVKCVDLQVRQDEPQIQMNEYVQVLAVGSHSLMTEPSFGLSGIANTANPCAYGMPGKYVLR